MVRENVPRVKEEAPVLPDPNETPTVSVEEAGRLLGVSRGSAYEAAASGELPTIRIGRRAMLGADAQSTPGHPAA
jgi:excisionase family DNA binding protein